MQGELPAGDAFLVAGGGDELVGELGRLPRRNHPADHVAAQHIEDHVGDESTPPWPTLELGEGRGSPFGGGWAGTRSASTSASSPWYGVEIEIERRATAQAQGSRSVQPCMGLG